jgi:hypothetical protein
MTEQETAHANAESHIAHEIRKMETQVLNYKSYQIAGIKNSTPVMCNGIMIGRQMPNSRLNFL